jgi:hypothetical protein
MRLFAGGIGGHELVRVTAGCVDGPDGERVGDTLSDIVILRSDRRRSRKLVIAERNDTLRC